MTTFNTSNQNRILQLSAAILFALAAAPVIAQTGGAYDLSWDSIDGGGQTFSTGGTYVLGGTIGQHDAGILSGGTYQLAGGFWPATQVCHCPGDMNHDGRRDAPDIQQFVDCLISGGSCSCADVDSTGGITTADTTVFVGDLLAGVVCQ